MSTITTANFQKTLWPGVKMFFQQAWKSWEPQWVRIFETMDSERAFEEMVGQSGFGLPHVKPEGQGIDYDSAEQGHIARFRPDVWALGFVITKEAVTDDLYGVQSNLKSNALVRSMRVSKEMNAANILNRGFDPAYTMGPDHDGRPLFAVDHPTGPYGADYSNMLAVPADLSEASLEQAMIQINGYTDNRGLQISAQPQELIIPRQEQFNASRILDSEYRSGGSLNDTNAIRQNGYLPGGFHVNQYLTDPNAWFLKTTVPYCLIHYSRWGMEFSADNSFDTMNAKYKAVERYSLGWAETRGLLGSAGT